MDTLFRERHFLKNLKHWPHWIINHTELDNFSEVPASYILILTKNIRFCRTVFQASPTYSTNNCTIQNVQVILCSIVEHLYQPTTSRFQPCSQHINKTNGNDFHWFIQDHKSKFQFTILWNTPNINVSKQCVHVTNTMKAIWPEIMRKYHGIIMGNTNINVVASLRASAVLQTTEPRGGRTDHVWSSWSTIARD